MKRQYYTKSGTRVLRVQQSMGSCRYRIVSIKPEDSRRSWIGGAVRVSWTTESDHAEDVQDQLDAYAETHGLKEVTNDD